ncbi:MAG: type IV pilus modification protein PilV [Methylococcaceae bacterium]|nr:type IV pilus modification protein PilV [Methylococcaceae bacterium]
MFLKNKGFTLLEVLITVIILAVGLLGLAGLQVKSMRNNLSSEHRSQAALLAYDMADRIRSNQKQAKLGNASRYVGNIPTAASAAALGCNTLATACSWSSIAEVDLAEWQNTLTNTLPGASASGAISSLDGVFTITVNWDDNRDGNTDASDALFTLSFQP